MTTTPFTYVTNNTVSFLDFMRLADDYTNHYLGIALLMIIGFVSFLSLKAYSTDRAFGFSGTILLISAIFLRFLGFVNDKILILVIVIFITSVIFLMRERSVEQFGV